MDVDFADSFWGGGCWFYKRVLIGFGGDGGSGGGG